ncbi:hypothetical protein MTO96_032595 [Rhipicephalus appendiculatus]
MREQVFSTRHRQQHAASSTVSYSGTTAGRSMARGLFFPYGLRPENSRRRRSYSFSAKKIGRPACSDPCRWAVQMKRHGPAINPGTIEFRGFPGS